MRLTSHTDFALRLLISLAVVEERTRIWQNSKKPEELYPYRASIEPIVTPDESHWLDAEPYHDLFQWTQRWPRANWTLAYQGNLHEIPEADFQLREKDMRKAAAAAPAHA